MAQQGLSSSCSKGSTQIWAGLSAEGRARAVRLMVQLALKLVVTQLEWPPKEVNDVKPIRGPQSPS